MVVLCIILGVEFWIVLWFIFFCGIIYVWLLLEDLEFEDELELYNIIWFGLGVLLDLCICFIFGLGLIFLLDWDCFIFEKLGMYEMGNNIFLWRIFVFFWLYFFLILNIGIFELGWLIIMYGFLVYLLVSFCLFFRFMLCINIWFLICIEVLWIFLLKWCLCWIVLLLVLWEVILYVNFNCFLSFFV